MLGNAAFPLGGIARMRKYMSRIFLILVILFALPASLPAAGKPEARTLLALYDSRLEESPRTTTIHMFLEMPANHLGYKIEYQDVMAPLLKRLAMISRGVIVWFDPGTEVKDVSGYLAWLRKVARQGKKLIMVNSFGFNPTTLALPENVQAWNDILGYLGLQDDDNWNEITYGASIKYIDHTMVGFERKMIQPFPPISGFHLLAGSHATTYLRMHIADSPNDNFDMVVTSHGGGFVAEGYAIYEEAKTEGKKEKITQAWIINPFLFLKRAMNAGLMPVPDNTTLDGKRIFYSHLDGDGWNNISETEKYNPSSSISAEVIYKEILDVYRDFAFTVSLITADVDKDCFAVPMSAPVARKIFALPNVEPSSHTYSHPIYWAFFDNYTPAKEAPLLKYYPPTPSERFSAIAMMKRAVFGPDFRWTGKPASLAQKPKIMHDADTFKTAANSLYGHKTEAEILQEVDYMPRSYACSPFNLEQEVTGAVKTFQSLSPADKTVRLLQWPGDTGPFETAMAMVNKAGLLNINGGDSRFDGEYPSYSFVAPIGIKVKSALQIYASNSNEETYTDDWSDRFYGFRYLQATVKNTESPIRVSPFNIYFHMFSGQKQASLGAVKENLAFARTQDIIPITASEYADIAIGYFSTQIVREGERSWHIRNRGALQTLRFDDAAGLGVDFDASTGVLGQVFYQNNLYISLDPAVGDVHLFLFTKPHKNIYQQSAGFILLKVAGKIRRLRLAGARGCV